MFLRGEAMRRPADQGAAQITGQDAPLAHRVNARFGQRPADEGGNVAGRENIFVADRLERVRDLDEAMSVKREARPGEPRRGSRFGDPQNFVGFVKPAVVGAETARYNLDDGAAHMDGHFPLRENARKVLARSRIVVR